MAQKIRSAIYLFFFTGLILTTQNVRAQQSPTRVLFIGNSYIFTNNMPDTFATIAKSRGIPVEVGVVAPGGASFATLATNPTVAAKISEQDWNYVILQEQSQVMGFRSDQITSLSLAPAIKLVNLIRANAKNAKIVFYNTWGRKNGDKQNCQSMPEVCSYKGMQDRIDYNYRTIAIQTKSGIAPVGQAWRNMRRMYPNIELYGSDGSHPSEAGSYLAAYTFYKVIFGNNITNANAIKNNDDSIKKTIQSVVDQTMATPQGY